MSIIAFQTGDDTPQPWYTLTGQEPGRLVLRCYAIPGEWLKMIHRHSDEDAYWFLIEEGEMDYRVGFWMSEEVNPERDFFGT